MDLAAFFKLPVGVLQEIMSVEEFYDWMARDRHISPIGERREDRRFAVLARVVFACLGVNASVEGLMAEMAAVKPLDDEEDAPVRKPISADLAAKSTFAEAKMSQELEAKQRGNSGSPDPTNGAR